MRDSIHTEVASLNVDDVLAILNYTDSSCVYGLIDAAQYPGFKPKNILAIRNSELISLLGDAAQENAIFAGPLLLPQLQKNNFAALKWLLAELAQRPFASLMISSASTTKLVSHLSWLTDVEHEDGTEWVMRFFDPRILPHWLEVLTAEQKFLALRGIHRWIYLDVRGQWQIIEGENQEIGDIPEQLMRMSVQQHELLMQKCLPYMVMDMLNDDDASLLETIPKYQRYDFIHTQLNKAHTYKLESMMDVKTYCMLAVMLGTDFDLRAEAKLALAAALQQSAFSQRVQAWTPAQWDAISK